MNKNRFFSIASAVVGVLLTAASCSDDNKYESKIPVFDKVTVSPSTAAPGDTISGTLYFSYGGSYIKGTYTWNVSNSENGTIVAGEIESGPVTERSFIIPISKDAQAGTYTLTVKPRMMAAYAGQSPYIDCNSMGDVTTKLTIETNNQPEE